MAAREPLIDTELVAEFAEQPPVDKTPISPVGPARRDSIEQHLLHRPERDNLVEKNILPKSTAAPSLQAHEKELKKHMLADTLNDKIAHRPAHEELVAEGVLSEDPVLARRAMEERAEQEGVA